MADNIYTMHKLAYTGRQMTQPSRFQRKWPWLAWPAILLLAFAGCSTGQQTSTSVPALSAEAQRGPLRSVVRVVDGDTLVLDGNQKVRLIGVDTPETNHPKKPVQYFGKQATAFTRRMVEEKQVRLDYDWQKQDKYGRTLAYVYLESGELLNAEIIKQGYGFAYTKFPFRFLEDFRRYEREARNEQRGLWKKEGG